MWRKESKAKIIIEPYLLTINYLLYKPLIKTMRRCINMVYMYYFFERQHTVLILYSKQEYFSKYFHTYKSNLGRVVYEL